MRGLVRTKNGTMIHSQDCHMAQRGYAKPWPWADTTSVGVLLAVVAEEDYRQCNRCRPLDGLQRQVLR